ncbi:DUF167 family protein [Rhodoblastus sp.]|uniref:DUF167 family protein n=1 Tax=Rhodoblastus sp. TaxID=1962975 RepID=UPI003F95113D
MSAPGFFKRRAGGIELHVRLTPKSSREALDGPEIRDDGACVLKARVRAVPEDGKANAALIALLAKQLEIPASRISLASGATARQKTFFIGGDPEVLVRRLSELFPDDAKA